MRPLSLLQRPGGQGIQVAQGSRDMRTIRRKGMVPTLTRELFVAFGERIGEGLPLTSSKWVPEPPSWRIGQIKALYWYIQRLVSMAVWANRDRFLEEDKRFSPALLGDSL